MGSERAYLSQQRVGIFLDAVLAMADRVETHFMWRPQLREPGDELVLEAAVNGQAAAIVTFNQRDFGDTPATCGRASIVFGSTINGVFASFGRHQFLYSLKGATISTLAVDRYTAPALKWSERLTVGVFR